MSKKTAGRICGAPLALLIAGCAHLAPRPGDDRGLATVRVASRSVKVFLIDRKIHWSALLPPLWRETFKLAPGEHTLTLATRGGFGSAGSAYVFRVRVEAGRVYSIENDPLPTWRSHFFPREDQSADRVWIEDSESREPVGSILFSRREPVKAGAPVDIPGLFAWRVPEVETGTRRMLLSRREGGLDLGWDDEHLENGYSIKIGVYKSTDASSQDEFSERVKRRFHQRIGEADPNDKSQEEKIEAYPTKRGFCVRYAQVSMGFRIRGRLDDSQGAPLDGDPFGFAGMNYSGDLLSEAFKPRLLIERYGYDCTMPDKKGYDIVIEYAHRSVRRERDPDASESAGRCFAALKF